MFRKIVSNLAFSPALVGQLGFYAKRLKKEEATRRLGLVFTALALIVQSLTVFTPPQSANAANASDFIYGGVANKAAILAEYDKVHSDFKDIMDYAGITRAELANMQAGTINSKGKGTGESSWKTWGRQHVFSAAQGEVKHVIPLDTGGSSTVYSKPLWLYDSTPYTIAHGSTYAGFVGNSAKRGPFAIMKDCGNLITTSTPKPDVKANFIAASCSMIRGKAIDGRNPSSPIKVYLYYGGPPGSGSDKSDGIMTQASDNTFAVAVPEKYKKLAASTKVWGVMIPLAGWSESTVQFDDTASIPGGCTTPTMTAACENLTFERISRTDFKLKAKATTANGALVRGYNFTVKDATGNVVASDPVGTSALTATSKRFSVAGAGAYTADVIVKTNVGDKTNENCKTTFRINSLATPGVTIEKRVDDVKSKTVNLNTDFVYSLKITNIGDTDLTNVVVNDTPPAGVTMVSASRGTIRGTVWADTIASLKAGESIVINITARVPQYVPGRLVNNACVNAREVNPTTPTTPDACDTATVSVPSPVPTMEVCDLTTKLIVTIETSAFDPAKYSRNLDDCKKCDDTTAMCTQVVESKTGKNLTQGVDATTIKAQASDRIEYTVFLENVGSQVVTRDITEELSDVLEYAKLNQTGGGTFNETSHVLSWTGVTLQPGEKTSRSFVVQLLDTIPSTARGTSEPSSFDCIMTNAFGNTVAVPVACEAPKIVETTVSELPKTGPTENMLFAGVVGSIVTFFWARSRQLGREVRLVRKDFNMGTI